MTMYAYCLSAVQRALHSLPDSSYASQDHKNPPAHFPLDPRHQTRRNAEQREWRPKRDDIPHVASTCIVWSGIQLSVMQVWIEPKHSVLLEVHATEIVESEFCSATWGSVIDKKSIANIGLTLRFPTCRRIRYDKDYSECHRTDQLQARRNNSHSRISH